MILRAAIMMISPHYIITAPPLVTMYAYQTKAAKFHHVSLFNRVNLGQYLVVRKNKDKTKYCG
jgi:hypothetical protein